MQIDAGTRATIGGTEEGLPELTSIVERGGVMDDPQIHGTIEQLVAEEHELWQRESSGNASDDDRRRLESVRVSLDQCWDLLRQRRARRDAGFDPEQAELRSPEVVERYEQ
jgi:hypothetical protein